MSNDQRRPPFDLEERTAIFGESVIGFAKRVPVNLVTTPLIGQVVRSGTSVGSNYVEADDADSKKDFRFKIGLCRREAKETRHWLRMIVAAERTYGTRLAHCGRRQQSSISFSRPFAASATARSFSSLAFFFVIHWSFWFRHW